MSKQRQQELRKKIADVRSRHGVLLQQANDLQQQQNEQKEGFDAARKRYSEACRAEVLGQSHEREKIERQLSAVTARITGLEVLIVEKNGEVAKLQQEMDPLEVELRDLLAAEERERVLAEIDSHFEQGKTDVRALFVLQTAHANRLELLRSKYDLDAQVKSKAYRAAELLANARKGMYLDDTFDAEELKEIRQTMRL